MRILKPAIQHALDEGALAVDPRRGVKWLACDEKTVRVRSESTLKNATILRLRRGGEFHAWGFEFDATTTTIKRNQEQTI